MPAESEKYNDERARSNAIDFVDNPYLKVEEPGESKDQSDEIVVIDKDSTSRQGVMLAPADGAYSSESDDECGAYQSKLNK